MKHLFAVVREAKENMIGEVKSVRIQRGCVYEPVVGKDLQDVSIDNYKFTGTTWVDNLFSVIDSELVKANSTCMIFCNKSICDIGHAMNEAISAVVLLKQDESNELYVALLNNAIDNGVTEDNIKNAIKNKDIDSLSKILICSVLGLESLRTDLMNEDQLMKLAIYVLKGNRFDQYGIYYVNKLFDNVKEEHKQFWININEIKKVMIEDIESNLDVTNNVAPIKIQMVDAE